MRVVLDTNVFISAALKETSVPLSVVRWVDANGKFLKSAVTESELLRVLQRPHLVDKLTKEFASTIEHMLAKAEMIAITRRITICRDEKDNKFLELALNGRADIIVSGDADLLVLGRFETIPIINPAAFARTLI